MRFLNIKLKFWHAICLMVINQKYYFMKMYQLIAMGVLCSLLSVSCRKTAPVSSVNTKTYASIEEVFAELKVKPKTVAVDAAAGGNFFGNSGTHYYFMPNSFCNAAGVAITGNVDIQVAEYLKKGDMLFSKMLPISNREPLISGGEISVTASQNGQKVFLKNNVFFSAMVPQDGKAPTGMEFFAGEAVQDTATIVNWVQPATDSAKYWQNMVAVPPAPPIPSPVDSLQIISNTFGMCNADRFLTSPNYKSFTVTIAVNGATLTGRPNAYAIFDQYKGLWPLGLTGSYAGGKFTENHVPDIPVHFVAFIIINGKFYGGMTAATPADGGNYTVTLNEVNITDFKEQVQAL
jgi:hypothetical protein